MPEGKAEGVKSNVECCSTTWFSLLCGEFHYNELLYLLYELGKAEYASIFSISIAVFDSSVPWLGLRGFASCHCIQDPLAHLAGFDNFVLLFWS